MGAPLSLLYKTQTGLCGGGREAEEKVTMKKEEEEENDRERAAQLSPIASRHPTSRPRRDLFYRRRTTCASRTRKTRKDSVFSPLVRKFLPSSFDSSISLSLSLDNYKIRSLLKEIRASIVSPLTFVSTNSARESESNSSRVCVCNNP